MVFLLFRIVQELFKEVHDNGYTTTASMEQLLCENCDRFVFILITFIILHKIKTLIFINLL